MKKAIILAAGVGSRLKPLTDELPKCLLPANGKTLLDFSLQNLIDKSIHEVIFVTGHKTELLEKHLDANYRSSLNYQIVYNDKYATSNNIYSVWLARNKLGDDMMLLNSDIIYHSDILKKLLQNIDHDNRSLIVVDDHKKLVDEDMKVISDNGLLRGVKKSYKNDVGEGEYIGILYLRKEHWSLLLRKIEEMLSKGMDGVYYEDALHEICHDIDVHLLSTDGKEWTEVDGHDDLERARAIAKNI
ncbi:MAG: phosphocholine cytidylyltransferase family protein [Spirochaetes bacterium]|nr:phosphocholine cytidylyltransferase family protein [Spirochaetota bacterium]